MADTYNEYNGTGSQDTFTYDFPYLKTTDVKVSVDGVLKELTTDYTRPTVTSIQFNSDKIPADGTKVRVYRDTDEATVNATFYPGSAIKSSDLNDNFLQAVYIGEEGKENADDAWNKLEDTIDSTETWVSDNTKIGTTGAVDARVDSKIDTELTNSSKNFSTSGTLAAGATTVTGNIAVSGTVDGRDIAADGTKLDGIESGATADQTNAEIRAAVEAASDSNVFTDADHSKLNAIEAGATADQTVSEIKSLIAGSPLDASHLAADSVGDSEIATGALDNRYYTEAECDARYFNVSTGDTIKDGDAFPDNDTTIATTAAINDRIVDLLDDVGGFVPIANETSFPNANPDVNNGAGTLISIKALSSNLTSNGSGVATIANGTVGNSTVTITGLDNSTTYAAPLGMIVETTTTLNTYAFHRQVPQGTDVSTVAGSISNVNTVASNISNVNTVAGINGNVTTVAGISSNVTTVANDSTNIGNVSGSIANVNTTAGSISNVNTVAGSISNVNTVAGNNSNVTTVAGISSDVTTVANDATDIGAVAAKATEIGRLGTADAVSDLNTLGTTAIVSDLDTCATNISNINNVGGSIANVNSVASNLSTVNDFGARYRVASSAPTSSLDTGDLYFNTTSNELRVYNGSTWQGGVTATGNIAGTGANTFTGNQSLGDNLKFQVGTGNDLQIYHSGTNSVIDNNTGGLYIRNNVDNTDGGDIFIQAVTGENSAIFTHDGSVALYHDGGGTHSFKTRSNGNELRGSIQYVEGLLRPWSATGVDLGTDADRFQDLYIHNDIDLKDDGKLLLGNSDDLQIYHDGTDNIISNSGTTLAIHRATENADNAVFEVRSNHGATNQVKFKVDGDGDVLIPTDTGKLQLGAGSDLEIYHDGSHSYIKDTGTGELRLSTSQFTVQNAAGDETLLYAVDGGAVGLKYNDSLKFETNDEGVKISGFLEMEDSQRIQMGTGDDLHIYHDGVSNNHSYIKHIPTDGHLWIESGANIAFNVKTNEKALDLNSNGSVALYYDGGTYSTPKFETTATGVKVTGDFLPEADNTRNIGDGTTNFHSVWASNRFRGGDNVQLNLGASQDLIIKHDGTTNLIESPTGADLHIKMMGGSMDVADQTSAKFIEDGAVELYYDGGTAKFETTSTGAKVIGRLDTTGATHVGGQNTVHAANTLAIGHEGSSKSQLRAYGADASTKGTIEFKFTTSDGSANDPNITFAAGGATFGGDVSIGGSINETIHTIASASATQDIDPANGTIQRITLSQAGHTITFTNMTNGESVLLMVEDGSSGTVTTWTGVTWVGGSAPTLATSGYSLIEVWKAKNAADTDTVFACYMGDVA